MATHCDRCGRPLDASVATPASELSSPPAPEGSAEHAECARARTLEPPRYCAECGRRLVVQVTPRGWTARCSEHGATLS